MQWTLLRRSMRAQESGGPNEDFGHEDQTTTEEATEAT
jgi:hypothetical protein